LQRLIYSQERQNTLSELIVPNCQGHCIYLFALPYLTRKFDKKICFEVFAATSLRIPFFWDTKLGYLVPSSRLFEARQCVHFQVSKCQRRIIGCFDHYPVTQSRISEEGNAQLRCLLWQCSFSQFPRGLRRRSTEARLRVQILPGQRYPSVVNVCFLVQVSATGRSFAQSSPTECSPLIITEIYMSLSVQNLVIKHKVCSMTIHR
jgi:hypothetical protein